MAQQGLGGSGGSSSSLSGSGAGASSGGGAYQPPFRKQVEEFPALGGGPGAAAPAGPKPVDPATYVLMG